MNTKSLRTRVGGVAALAALPLLLLGVGACGAGGDDPSGGAPTPGVRQPASSGGGSSGGSHAGGGRAVAATRARLVDARVAHRDEQLDVPTFVWLSATAELDAHGPKSAVERARAVARELAPAYRLDDDALDAMVVRHVHDLGEGAIVVQLGQRTGGIDVFQRQLAVTLDRALHPVAAAGYLAASVAREEGTGFRLDARAAVAQAFTEITGEPLSVDAVGPARPVDGGYALHDLALAGAIAASSPARTRPVWFPTRAALEPAFYVELDLGRRDEPDAVLHGLVVSATTGETLFEHDMTASDSPFTYRVWADTSGGFKPWDGPQGNATSPHPTGKPDGYQTPYLPSTLVTLSSAPFSRMDPWLPATAVDTTSGNNAVAYADLVAPDGYSPGDVMLTVSAAGKFDRPYDPMSAPAGSKESIQAITTHLFYVVNYMHDSFYDSGYAETAGNAQKDNYGRGGLGGDPIKAESQDYSGRNNANASTPADGMSPRIQMYLFDGYAPKRLTVDSPGPAADLAVSAAPWGPQTFKASGLVELVDTGKMTATDGCAPLANADAVAGKVALVDRGQCNFTDKVLNAQAAGAIAVIIANNVAGAAPGLGGTPAMPIKIPVLAVSLADGNALKAKLAQGDVSVTLFRGATVDRDGALDTTIVSHEWGHTLSNRLIGNGSGITNHQALGMGEGWSDFVALLTIVRPEDAQVMSNDKWRGTYSVGPYVFSGGPSGAGNNSYYYGFRRYPYSVDFARDPLTFKHIQDGVALPMGAPQNTSVGPPNSEVHNTGEIWGTMLWECYAALLADSARLDVAEATRRMKAYLVASLKMTPNAPTFVEARDAVLAAAFASDAADFKLFTEAFARRGIGAGALAPARASTSQVGVKESFTYGNDFEFVDATLDDAAMSCDHDGVLDDGETGRLTVRVRNVGAGALGATTATLSTKSPGVTLLQGKVTFPTSKPYQVVSASVDVKLDGAPPIAPIDVDLSLTDPDLGKPHTVDAKLSTVGNYDLLAGASATDAVDSPTTPWSRTYDPALDTSSPWERAVEAGNGYWHGTDVGSPADHQLTTPPLAVAAQGALTITFKQRWSFETSDHDYDGGVIEISTDGGATWTDVGGGALAPSYNGTIYKQPMASPGDNVLSSRKAYVKASPGYPAWVPTTISLGTAYQGKTVRVRFRIGTDQMSGDLGWDIDDVALAGVVGKPFPMRVADRMLCKNHVPVAEAGLDQTVAALAPVALAGGGSDGDNDPLTYRWVQVGGPMVVLSSDVVAAPTFTAPAAAKKDVAVTFALVVNDGKIDSAPSLVTVTAKKPAQMGDGGAGTDMTQTMGEGDASTGPDTDGSTSGDDSGTAAGDLGAAQNADLGAAPMNLVGEGGGCGCAVGGGAPAAGGSGAATAALVLVSLALAGRRRRRRQDV